MQLTEEFLSKTMQPLNGSAIREIFHLLGRPGMISFAGGNPAMSALEPDVIRQIACEAIDRYGPAILQYGATEGLGALREGTAKFVSSTGIRADASQVLPTQGSGQGLDLLLKALINPGDAVLVEAPTFLGALQAMRTYGARLVPLKTDEGGVDVDALEQAIQVHHPKMAYLIPTFQNPSGRMLRMERRRPIAELAAKYGVVIAEDDPYRDVRFSGDPLPAIASWDEEGWVVYLTSFSKIISPGLRVGAAIVRNPVLMRKMVIGKQSVDVHSPLLTQAIVAGYLEKGILPAHIRSICRNYKQQLDLMLKKLDELPEECRHTVPEGGLFVWSELPERVDALAMMRECVDAGVAYVPGTHFYPEEGTHLNTLRLNFSNSELPQIEEGMEKLNRVIRKRL
ncbi:MAG: PLP-dependent aminotransferase family protein [Clostridia bacterium]|nr:PLP-dependent aminotransferase family protein [Clostridia bacterium]